MRGWTIGLWLGLVVVAGAGAADACTSCNMWNTCQRTRFGAVLCLGSDWSCMQAGRCSGPGMISEDAATLDLTLLEDSGELKGSFARVAPLAGDVAVGRGAARIAGRLPGGASPAAAVIYSGTGFFDEGTAAFRSPGGDGFALSRERAGRGAVLTVRALEGGRPGRVLAHERLGEDDALVVRVPFDGGTRVLVLAASRVSANEADTHLAAAQRELRAISAGAPQRPPFALEMLDE